MLEDVELLELRREALSLEECAEEVMVCGAAGAVVVVVVAGATFSRTNCH